MNIDHALWAAGFAGYAALLLVLLIRGRARKFPLFTCYFAANIVQTVTLYLVLRNGSQTTYFYVYWVFKLLETILQLCVFYEIAGIVFRPLGVWAHDIRQRFLLLAAGSVVVAGLLTWLASPPTKYLAQTVVIKGSFFIACLMSELFVITTALSTRVGLAWRNHVSSVAQGLGVYSIATVLIEGTNSYFGAMGGGAGYSTMERTRVAIYLCCIGYWIVTLYREEPVRREITSEMRLKLFALQRDLTYDLRQIRSGDNKP